MQFGVAQLVGAILIMWLLGNGTAWILRKFAPLGYVLSNAICIAALAPLGSFIYATRSDGRATFFDALLVYGSGGLVAIFLMAVQSKHQRPKPTDTTQE